MPGWRPRRKKPTTSREKGTVFERKAARYLQAKGLKLVESNFLCRGGEIDLIMQDDDTFVFIEVRYRRSRHYGRAAESVTRIKQQKIIYCAQCYIQQVLSGQALPLRFDVIAITPSNLNHNILDIQWYQNAFQ